MLLAHPPVVQNTKKIGVIDAAIRISVADTRRRTGATATWNGLVPSPVGSVARFECGLYADTTETTGATR